MKKNSIFILIFVFLLFESDFVGAGDLVAITGEGRVLIANSLIMNNSDINSVDELLNDLQNREDIDNQDKLIKNQPLSRFVNSVKLQGLNKITGKTFEIEAKIGETINFERLKIIPLKCWKSSPEESPENKLLIKIYEKNLKEEKEKLIFYGWIFSSSPSVSGLEHPLYDMRLEDCYNILRDNEIDINKNKGVLWKD